MSRNVGSDSKAAAVEQIGPDQLREADGLWLSTVDKAIEGEQSTLKALQSHVDEIDDTMSTLTTLHEKVKYDVMVPFGRVAMFPGKLVHTNEVHVHLSSSITVHTSTKHAREVLQRRREYVVEQEQLVQQQMDALKSRRVFADAEKVQDGESVQEIVEVYDEQVHGSLDTPMVREQVHWRRRYWGPPRNEGERAAEAADMEALRQFVAQHASGPTEPEELPGREALPGGDDAVGHKAEVSEEVDSDDEDSGMLARPQPPHTNSIVTTPATVASPHLAEISGLDQELDRLVAAFEGAAAPSETGGPEERGSIFAARSPLIEDVSGPGPDRVTSVQESADRSTADALHASAGSSVTGQVVWSDKAEVARKGGLRLFDKAAKPQKSILKKVDMPVSPQLEQGSTGPTASRCLERKLAPTEAELEAFSGVVVERTQVPQSQHALGEPKAPPAIDPVAGKERVSKFKSQRAAAASASNQPS